MWLYFDRKNVGAGQAHCILGLCICYILNIMANERLMSSKNVMCMENMPCTYSINTTFLLK